MNYRLNQSYFVLYPLTAPVEDVTEFACYYEIDYTFTGRNYLTVDVLEEWTLAVRPIAISAAFRLPYNHSKTQEQNSKPDDRWHLIFQNQNAISIEDWKDLTPKQQTEYVGLAWVEPDPDPEDPDNPTDPNSPAPEKAGSSGAQSGASILPSGNLKELFATTTPQGKRNILWVILVVVFAAIAAVSVWAIRKAKKAKAKAEVAALKYGKYSQNVADALT